MLRFLGEAEGRLAEREAPLAVAWSTRFERARPVRDFPSYIGENFAIRAHLPALLALGDLYEVAAVCTTRMESAQEAAGRFGVPRAFGGRRLRCRCCVKSRA